MFESHKSNTSYRVVPNQIRREKSPALWSRRPLCYALLLTGVGILFSRAALGEDPSLDDWKRAEAVTGCAGIPYQELARRCMDTMTDVHDGKNWACDDVPSLKGNEDEAANRNKRADELEQKLSSETDEKIREDLQNEIKEQREKAKECEERAKGAEKELELRKGFGEEALKLRETVQQHFRDAMDRADRESSSFSPEIKAIYEKKKGEWERSFEEHKEPIEKVKAGIQKCQDRLDRR
ncbi:MAG TPA: hypothetical protein VH351_08695 [Bryobacteraceae bacterium]|jgi:hypothetical protein|nr:hypothetical protein [Bryobacteraceae bacterium]